MKNYFYISIFFFLTFLYSSNIWSDDIWFMLPSHGQPVSGTMDIKIHPPKESVVINVWIEHDRTENVVWIGKVKLENNYTISVDTTRFKPGKYKIEALYFLYGEDFDGDVDIWVNAP